VPSGSTSTQPSLATTQSSSTNKLNLPLGDRCLLPSSTVGPILISLPPSPLAAGLTQVLGAYDLGFIATANPSLDLLAAASLWICDLDAFSAHTPPSSLRVVVFSNEPCPAYENVAYLHPSAPTTELLSLTAAWSAAPPAELSSREREILALVSRGLSNEEIASECYVSTATVKTHLLRSFRKLGVSDRASAVYKAVKMGLIV
jgi:DNA-binding CsgD family transcriptional regulator